MTLSQINRRHANSEDEVREALRRIPNLADVDGSWTISRLPSLTNRTFRIGRAGAAYVLRLPGPGTGRYIDRLGEAANARAAAAIGLGPEVVFADPARGLMLTRFIDGAVPLSAARLRQPVELRATVLLLRQLHESGIVFRGHMRLYEKMDEYIALAGSSSLEELRRAGERLRSILEPGWGPVRPCHIDPAPHNFVVAGNARHLVDWEYSAMCEPLWDLAGLSIEGEFDANQDANMLLAYFGGVERIWASRLHLYKIMLRLLAASWGLVRLADGNGPPELNGMIERLMKQAAFDLGAADLGRHIAAA